MQQIETDLSQFTYEDLMTMRRHMRAMLILVEQCLKYRTYRLTPPQESDKG